MPGWRTMVVMALPIPSPTAVLDLGRYAVGQVVETAASLATVPVRVMSLLGQTELLVSRITLLADEAERLIQRVTAVVGEADQVAKLAAGVVAEADAVAVGAARTVAGATSVADAAGVVVSQAGTTSAQAADILAGYDSTLRKAAPLAARFVNELTPEEVTAAIRMVDELPRLRAHLSGDVMPLLSKLDQVGPDLHALLEVTRDLHLAIAGLPGLKKLRRRGEERLAEDED